MRHLTLLMAMAFALGAVSVAQACPMQNASADTNIASADQATPSSTKITIPAPKTDG